MKKLLVVIVIMFLSLPLFAQSKVTSDLKKCEKMILISLRNQNDGVVESMISQLAFFNLTDHKELITNNIIKEIGYLRNFGNTMKIRKMAGLTADFINCDDIKVRLKVKFNYFESDKLFELMSSALENNERSIAKIN